MPVVGLEPDSANVPALTWDVQTAAAVAVQLASGATVTVTGYKFPEATETPDTVIVWPLYPTVPLVPLTPVIFTPAGAPSVNEVIAGPATEVFLIVAVI
jgi:hypothetical protein